MGALTRLGLQVPAGIMVGLSSTLRFDRLMDVARAAESSGFDSIWVPDHVELGQSGRGAGEPEFEALTLLGALTQVTSHVILGTLVARIEHRTPALLAKQITAVDVMSGGRAVLGMGIGGGHGVGDHETNCPDRVPTAEQLERLEEAVQVCRAMFVEESPSFTGRHYLLRQAANLPRPLRPGGPPILIGLDHAGGFDGSGGETDSTAKMLHMAAMYADACNVFGGAETVRQQMDALARHCEEIGRDPAGITRTRLGALVIEQSMQAARDRAMEHAAARGLGERGLGEWITYGTPESVGDQVGSLLEMGLDGVIFSMPGICDPEAVALAGSSLAGVLPATGLLPSGSDAASTGDHGCLWVS